MRSGRSAVSLLRPSMIPTRGASSSCEVYKHAAPGVNMQYISDTRPKLDKTTYDNSCGSVSDHHWDEEWSADLLQKAADNNAMNTWGPSRPLGNAPIVERGD